jgi:hypothetical protein
VSLASFLHLVGYPVALVVIARLRPVFRERRTSWFVAEEAATAAIVAGWALKGRGEAVAINAAWGLGLAGAWLVAGRRERRSERAEAGAQQD